MTPTFIPIRLTLAEICVAALTEAADAIDAAHDMAAFVTALDSNHRLWLALREVGMAADRDSEFAILRSSSHGHGLSDATVSALAGLNRRLAAELAANGDVARICTRVRLAYRERGHGGFVAWLLNEIHSKDRLGAVFAPAAAGRVGAPLRAATASV